MPVPASRSRPAIACALAAAIWAWQAPAAQDGEGAIRLIVRGDDFGYTHASNEGMRRAFDDGIMTAASLLVPAPWFAETADLARERSDWSLGVHLTITSEWNRLRWGPLAAASAVPSLLAPDGRFWGRGYYRPRPADRPPDAAPWAPRAPDPREVETELRAQIEQALRAGLRLDYVDCHMGLACREELLPVTLRLAEEFCLAVSSARLYGERRFAPQYPDDNNDEGVKRALLDALAALEPGLHLYVGHPALRSPELGAVDSGEGEFWYRRRGAVLAAWTDPDVRAAIESRGIELVTMREFVPSGCAPR